MRRAATAVAACRRLRDRPSARAGKQGLLLMVLLWLVGAHPATAQQPEDTVPADAPEVEAVRFPGAEALEDRRLADAIETRATRCRSPLLAWACLIGDWDWAEEEAYLDPSVLPADEERLATLYETWGYPDARVESRVIRQDDGDVIVEFEIDEGEPIVVESVEVRGLEGVGPPVRLPDPLPLDVGESYALPRLEATQDLIADSLAERGRPWAEFEVGGEVDEAARTARVVIQVDPGPEAVFGPTEVIAEPPIEESVVRERLAWSPGEPYRLSALEETEEALFRLPIVERAVVEPLARAPGDTLVRTRVLVGARDVRGVTAEGALSSTECLEFASFWRHRYFLGAPRLLSIGVGVGNLLAEQTDGGFPCTSAATDEFGGLDYFVEAELQQPWPGDPTTTVLAAAYAQRESAPNAYVQSGFGGRFGLSRRAARLLVLTLLYEPARNELDAAGIFFCGNFGVCDPQGIAELSEPRWLSPLQFFVFREPDPVRLRDPNVRPEPWERGPRRRWSRWVRAGVAAAAPFTGSDFDYGRSVVEGAATRFFGDRYELAGRSRLGLLVGGDVVPPQVRLYSGGVNTVRGVEQNLLGPRILVAAPQVATALGCELVPGGCPPGVTVDADAVSVRPLGGAALLEANIEGRVWVAYRLQLAAFVDFGVLGRDPFDGEDPPFATDDWAALVTPGVGVRILTGLGPVRVDVGYDPSGTTELPLITASPDDDGLVPLGAVRFAPYTADDPGALTEFWRRLQLHVAIGQPF